MPSQCCVFVLRFCLWKICCHFCRRLFFIFFVFSIKFLCWWVLRLFCCIWHRQVFAWVFLAFLEFQCCIRSLTHHTQNRTCFWSFVPCYGIWVFCHCCRCYRSCCYRICCYCCRACRCKVCVIDLIGRFVQLIGWWWWVFIGTEFLTFWEDMIKWCLVWLIN